MGKRIKWTIETVKEKCEEHGVVCLEKEYVNNKAKMRFKCGCGNDYEASWNNVTRKKQWQCSECSGRIKWTIEMVKKECIDNGVVCLEKEYVDNKTKMRFRCGCGNEYEAKWNSVTSHNQWQCSECSGKAKWTIGEIKRICKEHGVECLEKEYVNAHTKMRFKCKCGNEYEAKWNEVTSGNQWQCPECGRKNGAEKHKLDLNEIKKECLKHEIECLEEEYVNALSKMRFKCKCGNEYEARWNDVTNKSQWQCSECNGKTSRGEIITSEFLSNLLKDENLFERQKTFKDLVDEKLLSYDFFIPEFNILIEIQGSQHYEPIEIFGGEKQFKKQLQHDKLKRDYAEQNGFTLIEIPWNCNGVDTEEKLIEELKNKLSGLIK